MLKKMPLLVISAILLGVGATSCQQDDVKMQTAAQQEIKSQAQVDSMEPTATESQKGCSKTPDGVAGLPYSHGKVFSTLDEYLAHLKQLSAMDLPYWREIRPDVFEQVIHMTGAVPKTATRTELMEKYCFDSE